MNTRQWMTLPQTRKDAGWLWTGFQAEMHHLCAWMEDPEIFECSLPRPQLGDVVSLAQPWYERLMISYRTGDGSSDCLMNVIYDPDLLSVRFAIDRDPHGYELLIVRRHKHSLFMDRSGFLLDGDEAAFYIMHTLLVGFSPASHVLAA
jgi:hypothetical protein